MSDATKEIILRAWTDNEFKKRLLENPGEVFDEFDLSRSKDNKEIKIIENTDQVVHFVLPQTPDLSKVSPEDIKQMIDSVLAEQLVLPTILV